MGPHKATLRGPRAELLKGTKGNESSQEATKLTHRLPHRRSQVLALGYTGLEAALANFIRERGRGAGPGVALAIRRAQPYTELGKEQPTSATKCGREGGVPITVPKRLYST